jgi:hypothetical protein
MDEHSRAQLMGQLYAAGAVDVERNTKRIGFEGKAVRADIHRSEAVGGQGIYIGSYYADAGTTPSDRGRGTGTAWPK